MINKEQKVAKARDFFLGGYNCAQAVVGAFAEEMDMQEKDVFQLVSGLGGGIGGQRSACGTVTGMTIVASKLLGYNESDMLPEKRHLYALVQAMGSRFSENFGSLNCGELLKSCKVNFSRIPAERTAEYYQTRPCAMYVEGATGILCDMLNEEMK